MLLDWFLTPSAPGDVYAWSAAFAGHVAVGVFLVAALALALRPWFGSPRVAALQALAIGYAALWEAPQLAFGGTWRDGLTDWLAVMLGAVVAVAAWSGRGPAVAGAMLAAVALWWAGKP
jgi:VanZ family protein